MSKLAIFKFFGKFIFLGIFEKKSLDIMKDNHFGKRATQIRIHYVMSVLHKKLSQRLIISPKNPFDRKFLKIGSVIIVYSFYKKLP